MSQYLKEGAVKLSGGPECPPMSLHYKSLPGTGPVPSAAPQSYHLKKAGDMGGELRPEKLQASQVMSGAGN